MLLSDLILKCVTPKTREREGKKPKHVLFFQMFWKQFQSIGVKTMVARLPEGQDFVESCKLLNSESSKMVNTVPASTVVV